MTNSSGSPLPLIGRILISLIFILSGANFFLSFSMMTGVVGGAGIPFPAFSTVCAGLIELLGGLAVLIGFRVRIASWILFLFLIPTTLIFHKFWTPGAPREAIIDFQKNIAIMGGLLVLAAYGAGAYSVDNRNVAKA